MNKSILNEVKRNRELMGINESELDEQGFLRGVRDGIKKGYEKGKEFVKDKVIDPIKDKLDGDEKEVTDTETKNTDTPIDVEEYKQTTIKTYNDYITVEAETRGSLSVAQRIISATASEKRLGEKTRKDDISYRDGGGYKVISYYNKQ